MSFRRSAVAALAAISMVVIPTVAQAAAADSLSVRAAPAVGARVGAEASDENALGGGSIIIAIIAAAAVIAGIIIAADGDDDPASP